MMPKILPIFLYGEPVLRKTCEPLMEGEQSTQTLNDMIQTMYGSRGIGLAAPQVGIEKRFFVISVMVSKTERFHQIFINPKIVKQRGVPWYYTEGCLSVPNVHCEVLRQPVVEVEWYDENWKKKNQRFDGIVARVIQHEADHLDGKLFLDHINVRKILLLNELRDIKNKKVTTIYPTV